MIKIIIFDLGGVILRHRANIIGVILSRIFSISEEEGLKVWNTYKIRLLTGKLSSKIFLYELNNMFKTNYSSNKLLNLWKDLYAKNAEIDREVLDFVEELKSQYTLYLLTDTIDIHDEYNKTRGIYDKFTKVFKSFEERLAKADGKDFYLHVLEKIQAKPEKCVFIDDMEEQVNTAESVGAKGILYTNLADLKEKLT